MNRRLLRRWPALLAGLLVVAAGLVAGALDPAGLVSRVREAAFDAVATFFPRQVPAPENGAVAVAVVDIDRAALDLAGPWPWPRETLAELVAAVAAHEPGVIALDVLLTERRGRTPSAIRLNEASDARLAEAIGRQPAVIGLVLDPEASTETIDQVPLVAAGPIAAPGIMKAPGASIPAAPLRGAARGIGALSLAAPDGEPVRSVPLLAAAGPTLVTGLALEAVRVAQGDVTLIAGGDPPRLRIGPIAVPLEDDAALRLHFAPDTHRAARTMSAANLLARPANGAWLKGKIVFVGASAPEAGGLRATPVDPFLPSVQIQAEAAEQIIAGQTLTRPAWAPGGEAAATVFLSLATILVALFLAPGLAILVAIGVAGVWIAVAAMAFANGSLLIDPVGPPIVATLAFQATALAGFALARRERLAIERRFAQHLPPEVVRRIADNPASLRLEGEERTITALFTDIEGFTALTERAGPRDLILLLDRYLERVCGLVVEHGGMVDKIVGDAVHALFNAPVDLSDHAEKAVACALAIQALTEELRREPRAMQLGLGRTRIGIETGRAILGDVGGGRKLDYTAHGAAINAAAKLEAANKQFGSSIAVGPGTVAACPGRQFRVVGTITPSVSSEPMTVSEPVTASSGLETPRVSSPDRAPA